MSFISYIITSFLISYDNQNGFFGSRNFGDKNCVQFYVLYFFSDSFGLMLPQLCKYTPLRGIFIAQAQNIIVGLPMSYKIYFHIVILNHLDNIYWQI